MTNNIILNDEMNHNNSNYSSLFNNIKSIDLSKGRIIEDRINSFELNDDEFIDYGEVVISTLKNKIQINKSSYEIKQKNEEMYKINLGPLEGLKKEDL